MTIEYHGNERDPSQSLRTAKCVYCLAEFNPAEGEGDHVLPRAFGDFEDAIVFRGICRACNNKLGSHEEELLRTAPEAIMRRLAGANVNRRGKPTGWQAASGVPPPRFVIWHGDRDELMDADATEAGQGRPVDQIVLVMKDGRNVQIRWFPSMTVESVRRRIKELGLQEEDVERSYWTADEKTANALRALTMALWPNLPHVELPVTPEGIHEVQVRIECKFTQKYYQSIAKIAFHYLLAKTRCGFTGHESAFAPLRAFIMNGGDQSQFFEAIRPTIVLPVGVLGDGAALLPARWMHVLHSIESPASVVVSVYTLFGPVRPPKPHHVTLLCRRASIVVGQHSYGHAYVYGNSQLGDMRKAFVTPLDTCVIS